MRKTLAIALTSLLLVMSLTSVAFAQSSVDGYSDDGAVQNQIQGSDDTGTPPNAAQEEDTEPGAEPSASTPRAATPSESGSLPFTGMDLALLAGAGVVLLSLGLGMRKLTRAPESA